MPTKHQRRRRDVPLGEWAARESQGLVVTRGELMSVLTEYDAARRNDVWYRRLWRYMTRPTSGA